MVFSPPRQDAEVFERQDFLGIAREKVEHAMGHIGGIGHRADFKKLRAVNEVVQIPIRRDRRKIQNDGNNNRQHPDAR